MTNFLKTIVLTAGLTFGMAAMAADQLHNTKWTTYNADGKPDAVLLFTDKEGLLSATIVEILDERSQGKTVCDVCKGDFKGKPLTGGTVLWDLKADPKHENKYIAGRGVEPESGRKFKGKAELSSNGKTLKLRGYKGLTIIGKTRILKRR